MGETTNPSNNHDIVLVNRRLNLPNDKNISTARGMISIMFTPINTFAWSKKYIPAKTPKKPARIKVRAVAD